MQHFPHPLMALPGHHHFFGAGVCKGQHVENILVIACADDRRPFDAPEMVHAEVVGDPDRPGQKFAFFGVAAGTNGIDDLDKGFLEDIFGEVTVPHEEHNRGVQFVFVPVYQFRQGFFISFAVGGNEVLVT
jgi:hypothetical protein